MDSVAPTAGEREDGRKDAHAEWEASDGEAPGWEAAEKERGTCFLRSVRVTRRRSSTAWSRNMCCMPEVLCRFLHRQILIGVCAVRYPGAAIFDPETNAVHCTVKGHAVLCELDDCPRARRPGLLCTIQPVMCSVLRARRHHLRRIEKPTCCVVCDFFHGCSMLVSSANAGEGRRGARADEMNLCRS